MLHAETLKEAMLGWNSQDLKKYRKQRRRQGNWGLLSRSNQETFYGESKSDSGFNWLRAQGLQYSFPFHGSTTFALWVSSVPYVSICSAGRRFFSFVTFSSECGYSQLLRNVHIFVFIRCVCVRVCVRFKSCEECAWSVIIQFYGLG